MPQGLSPLRSVEAFGRSLPAIGEGCLGLLLKVARGLQEEVKFGRSSRLR